MAEHEIPFTRHDFLDFLIGLPPKPLMEYFLDACGGQLKSVETLYGIETDPKGLFYKMRQEQSLCTFRVPSYLHSALAAAQSSLTPKFHGIQLEVWEREFIVANIQMREGLETPPEKPEFVTAMRSTTPLEKADKEFIAGGRVRGNLEQRYRNPYKGS